MENNSSDQVIFILLPEMANVAANMIVNKSNMTRACIQNIFVIATKKIKNHHIKVL